MKTLTFIQQVSDAEEGVRGLDGVVDLDSMALVIDDMDEYGVEQALQICERGAGAEAVAPTV